MALLVFGCGTTLSELEDHKNSVSVTPEGLSIQGTISGFQVPESKLELIATMAAAHAAFYLPFKGPSKTVMEIVYRKALNFAISPSVSARKVMHVIDAAADA